MIIKSRFDQDFYKFLMKYASYETMKRIGMEMPIVRYKFKSRGDEDLCYLIPKIQKELGLFKKLSFAMDEIKYLKDRIGFTLDFEDELKCWSNLNGVNTSVYSLDNELHIDVEGRWDIAMEFEIPTLAIVNELYFGDRTNNNGKKNLDQFIKDMDGHMFVDFGTRRRFSAKWHEYCVLQAKKAGILSGTSNVMLAKKHNIRPIGTNAHEWYMAFQAISKHLVNFQKEALEHWMLTYRGKFDCALTDTVGSEAFFNDFDGLLRKNFMMLRHDSGDPKKFLEDVFENGLGFHTLLFSDGLNPKKFIEILDYAKDQIPNARIVPPGIGTFFTNNVGYNPLKIVMKLDRVNGKPVVKISDEPGKEMGDEAMIRRVKQTFNIKR